MTDSERQIIVAIEMLRQQIENTPLAMIQTWQMYGNTVAAPASAPVAAASTPPGGIDSLASLDVGSINSAMKAAAKGWPLLIQLLNALASRSAAHFNTVESNDKQLAAGNLKALPANDTRRVNVTTPNKNATYPSPQMPTPPSDSLIARLLAKLRLGVRTAKKRVKANVKRFKRRGAVNYTTAEIYKGAKKARKGIQKGARVVAKHVKSTVKHLKPHVKRAAGILNKRLGRVVRGVTPRVKKVGGMAISSPIAMLVTTLMGAIGPIRIMSDTMSAVTSGFGTLAAAGRILGATLGPLLLPVTMALSVGMLYLSDLLEDTVFKALDESGDIFDMFLDAVQSGAEAMADFANSDAMKMFRAGSYVVGGQGGVNQFTGEADEERTGVRGFIDRMNAAFWNLADGTALPGHGPRSDTNEERPEKFQEALRMTITETQRSMMPKAQLFNDSRSFGKSAQMAGLNGSPFEQKMQEKLTKAVEHLQKLADRDLGPRFPGDTGAGDYRNLIGTGGSMGDF